MMRKFTGLLFLLLLAVPLQAQTLVNIAGPNFGTRAVADSFFSEAYDGAKAVDGSLERGKAQWYGRDQVALPTYLTFTFAGAELLHKMVLVQTEWVADMYHTKDFAIEISDDGTTWREITRGQLPDQNLARAEIDFPEPLRTKYLRIVVLTSYNTFQICGLAEVEIYASGVTAFGKRSYLFNGQPAPAPGAEHCGASLLYDIGTPQVMLTRQTPALVAALNKDETIDFTTSVENLKNPRALVAEVELTDGKQAEVTLNAGSVSATQTVTGGVSTLRLTLQNQPETLAFALRLTGSEDNTGLIVRSLKIEGEEKILSVPLQLSDAAPSPPVPPQAAPELRPVMARMVIEWDWRMADGIDTPREKSTYKAAIEKNLQLGDTLLADLLTLGVKNNDILNRWEAVHDAWTKLQENEQATEFDQEQLWRKIHLVKRDLVFSNPLADVGPLVFARQAPASFSHQLTQYYGRYARPGGDVCILEQPGKSMVVRSLTDGKFELGSFMQPEVSWDGKKIIFAYVAAPTDPLPVGIQGIHGRFYNLYEINADGSGLKQLTSGEFDDFAPRYLPDDRLVFISTRRLGMHRCGSPGCENYTLAVAEADGSNPHNISRHETQEWDPAIMNDGRIIYSRWDYVDRHAVFFEQLWTSAPDGTRPQTFYGNMSFNPTGTWEPRAIPGSDKIMATAAAHHAMTAGSIIIVDVNKGIDGLEPLTRLTPQTPFPESEINVSPGWYQNTGPTPDTEENRRWPGHCYRSPYPLSEKYFLASYSYDYLIGEPKENRANMFGIYFVDAFGNRELLYRDYEIASVWPMPVKARKRAPILPSVLGETGVANKTATILMQNVDESEPAIPKGVVKALRILQVLPKSTSGADQPPVGRAMAAPGKQVLGTVPVEEDGSAHFTVPADIPISFQALDAEGKAVQVMRSLTYLKPGEVLTCVGCHEPRNSAPAVREYGARHRKPSQIQPGPDGSKPFSYPILVQPVLDRACASCHGADKPAADIRLTGEPEGKYSYSYNALITRVSFAQWGGLDSIAIPGQYGATGSSLYKMLSEGHHDVELTPDEKERLITWMDTNALFYGTFNYADQDRQQRGERIAGPDLE